MRRIKRRFCLFCLFLVTLLCLGGIGPYSSASAILDLEAELESIHGLEYKSKVGDSGTEDMEFVIEPKSWLLTNWNLRNAVGIGYKYECKVIYTNYDGENVVSVRTITYQAIDPMGAEHMTDRACLDLESKVET